MRGSTENDRLKEGENMTDAGVVKCGHLPCKCLVVPTAPFCSEACADSEEHPSGPCPCQHPECIGTEGAEVDEDAELEETAMDEAAA